MLCGKPVLQCRCLAHAQLRQHEVRAGFPHIYGTSGYQAVTQALCLLQVIGNGRNTPYPMLQQVMPRFYGQRIDRPRHFVRAEVSQEMRCCCDVTQSDAWYTIALGEAMQQQKIVVLQCLGSREEWLHYEVFIRLVDDESYLRICFN